jgi:hypothetical protein
MSTGLIKEDGDHTSVEPEGYLGKLVELLEDYWDIPKGTQGYCTADLAPPHFDEYRFAVSFKDYGWLTLTGDNERDKFKIV